MIGNTYLLPRLEPRVREDADGLRRYVRAEFGTVDPDPLILEGSPGSHVSRVPLNGGGNGRSAKARRTATMAAAILLAPLYRRALDGRTAPNLTAGPACGDPSGETAHS